MGSRKAVKFFTAVCAVYVAVVLLIGAGTARAADGLPEVIILTPGHDLTRQFYLNDAFELNGFHNYETYFFIALPDNSTTAPATKPGVLTITLSTSATINFGAYINYSLSGFSYAIGGSLDIGNFYSVQFTTPQNATKAITLNQMYGFGFVAALINKIEGVVTQPVPCKIVFSLAAKK